MSFRNSMMEFFGLGAYSPDDEAYYDDPAFDDRESDTLSRSSERYSRSGSSYDDYTSRESRAHLSRDYSPAIISVRPRSYNDAKDIGEPFRDGDAVVMDLSAVDKPTAMRLIDFAAGLCFAARGKMHKLTRSGDSQLVFAIVPENARTSVPELERVAALR